MENGVVMSARLRARTSASGTPRSAKLVAGWAGMGKASSVTVGGVSVSVATTPSKTDGNERAASSSVIIKGNLSTGAVLAEPDAAHLNGTRPHAMERMPIGTP